MSWPLLLLPSSLGAPPPAASSSELELALNLLGLALALAQVQVLSLAPVLPRRQPPAAPSCAA